ncbi:aspartate/glutamate racemase family protein [Lentzea kentuckyensis]|uniref:aspartate/glutamate racemase family protein n=1 Tax=Lentzea kentuckyensis TaxID=360086 RepID=UPI000A363F8F|nr:aspartate/glutamate racemase family protein [Lentzea kentuckyensis]
MIIKVVNPNTSLEMTGLVERSAKAVAAPGTEVYAVSPAMGPESIESHYDEALSVPGLLEEIRGGEESGVDGYVVACFGDPGLDAAREVARGPVVGMAEAGMRTAAYLGRGFTVVTTLSRSRGRTWELAERYGMRDLCRGVHACDIPVLELEGDALDVVTAACARAVEQDEADAVVLGCAGMTDWAAPIAAAIGVPVVDGVQSAVLTVQALVEMGLRTGKRDEFATPLPKRYTGMLRDFGC